MYFNPLNTIFLIKLNLKNPKHKFSCLPPQSFLEWVYLSRTLLLANSVLPRHCGACTPKGPLYSSANPLRPSGLWAGGTGRFLSGEPRELLQVLLVSRPNRWDPILKTSHSRRQGPGASLLSFCSLGSFSDKENKQRTHQQAHQNWNIYSEQSWRITETN